MAKKKLIQCLDCDKEVSIIDKFEEFIPEDFTNCPLCGSENIEVLQE